MIMFVGAAVALASYALPKIMGEKKEDELKDGLKDQFEQKKIDEIAATTKEVVTIGAVAENVAPIELTDEDDLIAKEWEEEKRRVLAEMERQRQQLESVKEPHFSEANQMKVDESASALAHINNQPAEITPMSKDELDIHTQNDHLQTGDDGKGQYEDHNVHARETAIKIKDELHDDRLSMEEYEYPRAFVTAGNDNRWDHSPILDNEDSESNSSSEDMETRAFITNHNGNEAHIGDRGSWDDDTASVMSNNSNIVKSIRSQQKIAQAWGDQKEAEKTRTKERHEALQKLLAKEEEAKRQRRQEVERRLQEQKYQVLEMSSQQKLHGTLLSDRDAMSESGVIKSRSHRGKSKISRYHVNDIVNGLENAEVEDSNASKVEEITYLMKMRSMEEKSRQLETDLQQKENEIGLQQQKIQSLMDELAWERQEKVKARELVEKQKLAEIQKLREDLEIRSREILMKEEDMKRKEMAQLAILDMEDNDYFDETNFQRWITMKTGTHGRTVYWYTSGEVYSYPDGKLLVNVEGYEASRGLNFGRSCAEQLSRRVYVFRDKETNAVLSSYNGSPLAPILREHEHTKYSLDESQLVTEVTVADGEKSRCMRGNVTSVQNLLNTTRIAFTCPVFVDLRGPSGTFEAYENHDYFFDKADGDDVAHSSTVRIGHLPPFLQSVVTHLVGWKLDSFELLPPSIQDFVAAQGPRWKEAPEEGENTCTNATP